MAATPEGNESVETRTDAVQLGAGPFVFAGEPPVCTGDVELINGSDERAKVRAIPVVSRGDARRAQLGVNELRLAMRLSPGARARVPAHLVVDPHTPPGTYEAHLALGGQSQRVVVHVFEKRSLEVKPRVVRLTGARGSVHSAVVVVTNRGNVGETLRELALVFLEERAWVGRSLVYALRETGADEGVQGYLDRVTRELRATIARPARVTLRGEVPELPPGATREIGLEITLPNELIKGRTYGGSTRFMSGTLVFEVECNGAGDPKGRAS
jgi:hypothetical protein